MSGTNASPTAIVAGTGITSLNAAMIQGYIIEGSGGAVNITANPQIEAGATVGQILIIQGTSNTNTVTFEDGDGLSLNGTFVANALSAIVLQWNGTHWRELCRNN